MPIKMPIPSLLRVLLWRLHARLDPVGFARALGVKVGDNCRFLNTKIGTFGSEPYLITIGNHVTITAGVQFVTHDGGVWIFRETYPNIDIIAPIRVGNNVFIGINAIILPGVTIGDNCVIGAGSVVSNNIPSNSVAAGVPAKPIKTVERYWEKVQSVAVHLRNLDPDAKRSAYLAHCYGEGASTRSRTADGESV